MKAKVWPADRGDELRQMMLMLPWLLVNNQTATPTLEDWKNYEARLANAQWN